jgi:lipid-A-disaccharide synthase-like uncharacterized protein
MFKKDNWILGIALGILIPVLVYGLLYAIVKYWSTLNDALHFELIKQSTLQLAGIFVNMFTFRYYMVNLRYDKTGRGILLATFVYAGIFVYLYVV